MGKDYYEQKIYDNVNLAIAGFVPKGKTVLDVGCNQGELGKFLQNTNDNKVYGVDISGNAIDKAKEVLTEAVRIDVEKDEMPFHRKFDVIIFGDILEHLVWPQDVLRKYSDYLSEGGIIIVSVPNIAHLSIRFSLLFGNWNYVEAGILDDTHLRFFTLKTIKRLFKKLDLKIKKFDITPSYFLVLRYFNILKKISKFLSRLYPSLFAVQFVFVLKKK